MSAVDPPRDSGRGRRRSPRLVVVGLVLLSAGCSELQVLNVADVHVRVEMILPDGGVVARTIAPASGTTTLSATAGGYTVRVLPDESYRQLLEELRDRIGTTLFDEGASLSADDVASLVQQLLEVDRAVASLPGEASCSGTLVEAAAVTAMLSWEPTTDQWRLECP